MKRKYSYVILVVLLLACDSYRATYFRSKAGGHRAFGLEGTYVFTYLLGDSTRVTDTLRFERIRRNEFLITELHDHDTLFMGEIVKRRALYFLNKPAPVPGWWEISAFRLTEDSLYNYWGLSAGQSYEPQIEGGTFFPDHEMTDSAIYVHNTPFETYKAMEHSASNGLRVAYRELEISQPAVEDTPLEVREADWAHLVYPNPASEYLIIENKTEGAYLAELFDMNGKRLRSHNFRESYYQMNVGSVQAGNYILRISSSSGLVPRSYRITISR